MCSKFCNGKSSDIVGYTPPTLDKGVRWFVDFAAFDPARDIMRRKRYYIKDNLCFLNNLIFQSQLREGRWKNINFTNYNGYRSFSLES